MEKLGLGKTLYYRTHALALEALTQGLWDRLHPAIETEAAAAPTEPATRAEEAELEWKRLRAEATWQAVELRPVLDNLRPIIGPLAYTRGITLQFDLTHEMTILRADRIMLRQTLLNVLTYGLDQGFGGQVRVVTFGTENEAGLQVEAQPNPTRSPLARPIRQGVGLELCEKLMREMGGILTVATGDGAAAEYEIWQAHLAWPTTVNPTLLVIDDNAGLADLFQRFLAGTAWQVQRATSGGEARRLIVSQRPGVISLDVMMPGEDGWELLLAFKQADVTRSIPVIICSVFNEPQLAQTLGAAAYLPKPVTRLALLEMLKPWQQVGASLTSAH
jgi:CheY-like chemotaxis protein